MMKQLMQAQGSGQAPGRQCVPCGTAALQKHEGRLGIKIPSFYLHIVQYAVTMLTSTQQQSSVC